MFNFTRSASAPELYVRSSGTQVRNKPSIIIENFSYSSGIDPSSESRKRRGIEYTKYEEEIYRRRLLVPVPSRLSYISYVYVMLGIQIFISMVHWLLVNYHWRPRVNIAHQCLYALLLLLTWMNLTLSFLGFRRLQITSPINWIIFVSMFESLTLLVICVCVRDYDLKWYFILIAVIVILVYTPLGLWFPSQLSINLWIMIFASLSVMIVSAVALLTNLAMHIFIPTIVCLAVFGPWTMHNGNVLHIRSRRATLRCTYMEIAAKMFITYGFTVGVLIIVSRLTNSLIEAENCKGLFFCQKKSPIIEVEPEN